MYEICESIISAEDKTVKTYGLKYGSVKIEDISTDEREVAKLIASLNRLDVSPVHIYDIIDDFLG